eukprot:gnl/MRDRNA2_/MRDRNA2_268844_c0_seq1.p1 gnl/MRDRNA2_/MRDRNA2_268844_c0~~gnl/MRDRNA2_/MRDRNA2_268844_c0_seq1.p1  ORF type:complete len:146 (+),score=10.30 gnl/MRDRNA2_/MRDRNA2_268844_c0_seq1:46-438(+)
MPHDYADRFHTFVISEVLGLSPPFTEGDLEASVEVVSSSYCRCCYKCLCFDYLRKCLSCGFSCCLRNHGSSLMLAQGSVESLRRWRHLWQRRRVGLVRERIETERVDHMRRIEELETMLSMQETRILTKH